ncbi:MAG TPA: hypothetical protein DDX54_07145 [Rhodospirillaceae bacterium]|jgi:hypothetical protein|nr:hypothetical protein [Alphaproteobacteria bacterium]HBH27149.1 hypothetical protein [Rhodospirillaceae bacterium]
MTQDHIKMPDIEPVIRYATDGATADFPFPFPIFASEDLAVTIDDAPVTSGFAITGAGATNGGTATFATAPAAGSTLVLQRVLPIERVTDFLEGGEFAARALNTELDYMTALIQQVDGDNDAALRYPVGENPGDTNLPSRAARANKVLGFDGDGNPIAVSAEGSMAAPDFTAPGAGAVTRASTDKFTEAISVKDFGAAGDGVTDDTLAFARALAAHDAVFVPPGDYVLTGPIVLQDNQSLTGAGAASVLACTGNTFDAVQMTGRRSTLARLAITGGDAAVRLKPGATSECTQNSLQDLTIDMPNTGIVMDGGDDPNYPCYWNNVDRVLIERPLLHGVHLTKTGGGDTPNANRLTKVRVFSKGAATTGHGFYVEHGQYNNALVDCEADMNGASAQGCFTVGPASNATHIVNAYAEGVGLPNVKLEAGSQYTSIVNLTSNASGAAILDQSGGAYTAYNAGFPYKNRLDRTLATDISAGLQRFETTYTDSFGLVDLDLTTSVHLLSSFGGAMTARLPAAADAQGAFVAIKKIDASGNLITITEDGGPGPDGRALYLGGENDTVTLLSNGAEWFLIGGNRMPGNTRFVDTTGTYDIDMAVDVYLISSFGGAVTARLPAADAPAAIGRRVTIKKTDPSANLVTVTEQGGSGPDGYAQPLSAQYNAITVVSDGGSWWITGRF